MKKPLNKNILKLTYKLLIDFLIASLIVFFAFFLLESILPGIVLTYSGFLKTMTVIVFVFLGATYLGKTLGVAYEQEINKIFIYILGVLFLLNILISLQNFRLIEKVVVGISSLFLVFYFHKVMLSRNG